MRLRTRSPDARWTALTGFYFTGRLPRYIVGLPYKILRKNIGFPCCGKPVFPYFLYFPIKEKITFLT
jgi:hypothetical protein